MVPCVLKSPKGKQYTLVVVDDSSRFIWFAFCREKLEAMIEFSKLWKELQALKNITIAHARNDHGREFYQLGFDSFCAKYGVSHNFSDPKTPQQNEVVERKNHTLKNMSRTMLLENGISKTFWAEMVNTITQ